MSSYALYDFTSSLDRVGIQPDSVERVIAAWGDGHESWAEWEGGFVLRMKDGRYAYVWGWCDTSGWGCQDGAEVEWSDTEPDLIVKRGTPQHFAGYLEVLSGGASSKWEQEWDRDPADLNLWLTKSPEERIDD